MFLVNPDISGLGPRFILLVSRHHSEWLEQLVTGVMKHGWNIYRESYSWMILPFQEPIYWRYLAFFKAYVSGLNFRELAPQNGTVPPVHRYLKWLSISTLRDPVITQFWWKLIFYHLPPPILFGRVHVNLLEGTFQTSYGDRKWI